MNKDLRELLEQTTGDDAYLLVTIHNREAIFRSKAEGEKLLLIFEVMLAALVKNMSKRTVGRMTLGLMHHISVEYLAEYVTDDTDEIYELYKEERDVTDDEHSTDKRSS